MLAGEHNLSWLERIFVGVMSTLMAAGITWTAVTVTQILEEQSAQAAKVTAVLYRVGQIEDRLSGRYRKGQAEKEHERLRGSIEHNWQEIKKVKARVNRLER